MVIFVWRCFVARHSAYYQLGLGLNARFLEVRVDRKTWRVAVKYWPHPTGGF